MMDDAMGMAYKHTVGDLKYLITVLFNCIPKQLYVSAELTVKMGGGGLSGL